MIDKRFAVGMSVLLSILVLSLTFKQPQKQPITFQVFCPNGTFPIVSGIANGKGLMTFTTLNCSSTPPVLSLNQYGQIPPKGAGGGMVIQHCQPKTNMSGVIGCGES
jgi:hypothetical protein